MDKLLRSLAFIDLEYMMPQSLLELATLYPPPLLDCLHTACYNPNDEP